MVQIDFVQKPTGMYTGYRQFACRINFHQPQLISHTQLLGKVIHKITGTAVQMWLEDGGQFFPWIEFAHRTQECAQFLRMVGIVIYIHMVTLDDIFKSSLGSSKIGQPTYNFLLVYPEQQSNRDDCYRILDIMQAGNAQLDILYAGF